MELAHVIVPLDDSDLSRAALPHGAAVARRQGARLVLYSRAKEGYEHDAREKDLAGIAADLDGVDVDVRIGAAPSAAAGIEEVARGLDGSLVCMTSHGRGGLGTAMLGSVAEETLRRLAAPVLLVGPGCEPDRSPVEGEVVACVDGSELSETILGPAAGWAEAFGQPFCLLQVISEEWPAEVAAAGVDPGDVRPDSYTAALAARLRGDGVQVDWEVALGRDPGQPSGRLVEVVRNRRAGLVALSTHGRTGLRRLIIGSVAMRVVHASPCPVLVARPHLLEDRN
jgi:nucleotide-binding universal stress UspA family protein